ncbi:MAG: 4-hydroxythreonine-4-phosphate dehydrogenase PdxA [Pseudomonadota bacterium]|nr:4-hydroxythreonine-4-phosphate dehydrogenase PdxA [Pseudomonadota bacterium]
MSPLYLTTGEPAGIGADISLMLASEVWSRPLVLLGDQVLLLQRAAQLGLAVRLIPYEGQVQPAARGELYVMHIPTAQPVQAGQLNPANAGYVLAQLRYAAEQCLTGQAAGVVTAPVQKSVINDAGIAFSGHTEFFQEQAGIQRVVMMLATPTLRVALATTHLPLRAVPNAITQPLLHQVLDILLADLQSKFAIARPKILVCGLNPHAGESGHLGREEIEIIEPVLSRYRAAGVNVGSALPADTLFTPQHLLGADAVLAMYHDQGLPVLKSQGFGEAVNITLGLPFIRTSVDHGTALSLAGTGQAKPDSLKVAIALALDMAAHQG